MKWAEVCARRLARHALAGPPAAANSLAEQVGVVCGAHAQVMAAGELSVGLRVTNITRSDVRDALWERRTLVKTYALRGTVHLLPAGELGLWLGALSTAPIVGGAFAPDVRLTADQTDAVVAAIADALADAELTLDELGDAVVERTGSWAGDLVMPAFTSLWPRWRQAVGVAAFRGALCFGPNRGRHVTYTCPRRWLPELDLVDKDTAHREVVRRYLYAYGPATAHHFARWFGVPAAWAVQLFGALATSGAIEETAVDGVAAWIGSGDTDLPDEPPRGVRLLPYFDAYVVGCHPRERVFPGRAEARALTGGQAGTVPVLLVDGVVAGVWQQRRSGRKLAITVEPFARLSARRRRELDDQVARVGEILEGVPQLTIGDVTIGPHA